MATTPNPFMDHAAPVLSSEPTITDQQKSDLWDAFHSKSPEELVQHLTPLAIPDDLKRRLFDAKRLATPTPPVEPVDKVTSAIQKMVALPPDVLDKAESHPQVMKAFTTAATTEPKAAQEPASTSSTAPKGSTSSAAPKAPKTPPALRPDGQPHFPAIDPTMHRILASNGGVYDVPKDRINDARKTDPLLHVLNPDE